MASVYGQTATVFDNMPFELAAENVYAWSTDPLLFNQGIYDRYYFNGATPQAIDGSGINGFAVSGEVLAALRGAQDLDNVQVGENADLSGLNPVDRHSISLLVLLLYATQPGNAHADWEEASAPLLAALFDNDIALAAGIDPAGTNGRYAAANKMLTMIAYSAIDEGTRVFGDTGIRALFDDAAELGNRSGKAVTPHRSS